MAMMLLSAGRSLRSRLHPRLAGAAAAFSSAPSAAAAEAERTVRYGPRNDWSRPEIQAVYDSPLLDLLFHGAQVHRHAHKFREVQQCTLLSIKTGGCSEDCSYCPQSSRYDTGLKAHKLMNKDAVLEAAKKAKEAGSTRFCMGAAWRETIGRKTNFNQILEYVKEIRGMGWDSSSMHRTGKKRKGRGSLGEMLTALEIDSSGRIGGASGGQLVGLRIDGGCQELHMPFLFRAASPLPSDEQREADNLLNGALTLSWPFIKRWRVVV